MYRASTETVIGFVVGLAVGVLQAVAFGVFVARAYPAEVGPATAAEWVLFCGGLVVLCTVAFVVSFRYRLVLPALFVLLAPVRAFLRERAAAPLELDYVTEAFVAVSRDLYLLQYPSAWLLWLLVALLLGVGEYAARRYVGVFPESRRVRGLSLPVERRRALVFAAVIGVLHTVLLFRFALGFGYFSTAEELPFAAWAAIGMVALAGVPAWLLAEKRLVTPFFVFVWVLHTTIDGQLNASVEDALGFVFFVWPVFLVICLLPGIAEYGFRLVGRRVRPQSA